RVLDGAGQHLAHRFVRAVFGVRRLAIGHEALEIEHTGRVYAEKSRSSFPGRAWESRRTPFTHTPSTPTAAVVRRGWPPGRSKIRCFGPRFTVAGSNSSRSAW